MLPGVRVTVNSGVNFRLVQWVVVGFLFFGGAFSLSFADSCSCEAISCDPCEVSQSLKFYTEKCEGGTKVKSCARPICVPLDPLPEKCVAKQSEVPTKREVASVKKKSADEALVQSTQIEIGKVQKFKGKAWVVPERGQKRTVRTGMKLYESDTIVTEAQSAVVIQFNDLNRVFVHENTKAKLTEYTQSEEQGQRRALIDLKEGKLRNTVKKKYINNGSSYYRVRTRSAVAGVRGTDFVVEFFSGQKHETKVATISGEVMLGGRAPKDTPVAVPKGRTASYVVTQPRLFDRDDMTDFYEKGYLTPVYKMTAKDLKKLNWKMSLASLKKNIPTVLKNSKSDVQNICQAPQGALNDCSWTCKNNPKGEAECRIDLTDVYCERKRCNANGQWKEDSRVPASESFLCPPAGVKVKSCDY